MEGVTRIIPASAADSAATVAVVPGPVIMRSGTDDVTWTAWCAPECTPMLIDRCTLRPSVVRRSSRITRRMAIAADTARMA